MTDNWFKRTPCWNCGGTDWSIVKGKRHGVVCKCGVNPMANFPKTQKTLIQNANNED